MASTKKIIDKNLNIDYDEEADVLYLSFGKPRPAISIEVKEGDFVRVDAYSDEIVGITIIDFKEKYITSKITSTILDKSVKNIIPKIIRDFKKITPLLLSPPDYHLYFLGF